MCDRRIDLRRRHRSSASSSPAAVTRWQWSRRPFLARRAAAVATAGDPFRRRVASSRRRACLTRRHAAATTTDARRPPAGIYLFGANDPWHFGDLATAMLTLFRCATLEDWTDVMYINIYGCHRYGGGIYAYDKVTEEEITEGAPADERHTRRRREEERTGEGDDDDASRSQQISPRHEYRFVAVLARRRVSIRTRASARPVSPRLPGAPLLVSDVDGPRATGEETLLAARAQHFYPRGACTTHRSSRRAHDNTSVSRRSAAGATQPSPSRTTGRASSATTTTYTSRAAGSASRGARAPFFLFRCSPCLSGGRLNTIRETPLVVPRAAGVHRCVCAVMCVFALALRICMCVCVRSPCVCCDRPRVGLVWCLV